MHLMVPLATESLIPLREAFVWYSGYLVYYLKESQFLQMSAKEFITPNCFYLCDEMAILNLSSNLGALRTTIQLMYFPNQELEDLPHRF